MSATTVKAMVVGLPYYDYEVVKDELVTGLMIALRRMPIDAGLPNAIRAILPNGTLCGVPRDLILGYLTQHDSRRLAPRFDQTAITEVPALLVQTSPTMEVSLDIRDFGLRGSNPRQPRVRSGAQPHCDVWL